MIKSVQHKLTALFLSIILFLFFIPSVSAADSHQTAGVTVIEISKEDMEREQGGAISKALLTAKENATEANICKIVVPAGTYYLYDRLEIYSNTWLSMNGVKLVRSPQARNMLRVGKMDSFTDGVTGYHYRNITIEGGVFDAAWLEGTVLKIGHAKNVMMKNVSFCNSHNYHFVETAAVDGLTVTGCSFSDQLADEGFTQAYEALQLDIVKDGNFYDYRSEDLCCKNVLIEDCTFRNCPRGVGSHTSVFNNPHRNITIRNNTFLNMGSVAIQTLGWANAHITGNLIDSVPRAIAVYTAAASGTCLSGDMAAEGDTVQHFSHDMETHWANVFIENNTITNCATVTDNYSSYERAAISVMGSNITSGALPQGVHQCINAAVRHNYISAKGNGIRVEYAKNIVVEGNVISSLGTSNNNDYGIVMRHNVSNAYINKNYIQNIPVNGIQLDTCSVKEIHSNDIMTTGKYGMGFYAATIDSIVNNEIRDTANRGILLSIGSSVTNRIAENRFLRTGSTAVKIDNDGSAAKLVDKNTIYRCGGTVDAPATTAIGTNYTTVHYISSLTLSDEEITLKANASYRAAKFVSPLNSLYPYTYQSSDTNVATVTAEGLITAHQPGTAIVTVSAGSTANAVKQTVTVNVTAEKPDHYLGDIDGDGYVTPIDYVLLCAHVAQLRGYEAVQNADLNADGAVDATDRLILAGYLAHTEGCDGLPVQLDMTVAGSGSLAVQRSTADSAEEMIIEVVLTEDPGIVSADFDVAYDTEALTYTGGTAEAPFDCTASVISDKEGSPIHCSVINDLSQTNSTGTGRLAQLRFRLNENAPAGQYPISVLPETARFFNADRRPVQFDCSAYTVEVAERAATVSGTVSASDPSGVTVELIPNGAQDAVQTVQTSADGSYTFEHVGLGDYTLRAFRQDCTAAEAVISVSGDMTAPVLSLRLIGDIDGDGFITVSDATMMQRHLAEFKSADGLPVLDVSDPAALQLADANGDGVFDIHDVTCLQRKIAEFV